jgi:SMODS and SLOG-associating 2TM effector domain 1/Protein of unknown function (DUF4231)
MDATADSATVLLASVWDKQSVRSQAANNLKQSLFRARTTCLLLTILAAVLATVAVQIASISDLTALTARILAAGAALSMGLVALMQKATNRERVQDWTRARSASEALKAETYTFLAGVAPYRAADRADQFQHKVNQVLQDVDDLTPCTIGLAPEKRDIPAVTDLPTYISARVQQQVDGYYRPQSAAMKHRADRYRFAERALAILALLLSFATTITGWQGFAAWSPVITTVVAAVAAHTGVQRYDALALEYARTYEQLERLLLNRSAASVDAQAQKADDDFVAAAEGVISIQNGAWMSRNIAAAGPEEHGAGPSANPQPV